MDPLTIVAAIAATSRVVMTVSTTLYKLIQDTGRVDSTVNALSREVENLKRTVTAIENVLQQPATQVAIQQDREFRLAKSVGDSLTECRQTLKSLGELLDGIRGDHASRN